MTTPMIEAIARSLHNADAQHFVISYDGPIPEYYTNRAQAALTAITEAGFVCVPREPTEAMMKAVDGRSYSCASAALMLDDQGIDPSPVAASMWEAMISAAQGDGA